jgi:hypothetical protein
MQHQTKEDSPQAQQTTNDSETLEATPQPQTGLYGSNSVGSYGAASTLPPPSDRKYIDSANGGHKGSGYGSASKTNSYSSLEITNKYKLTDPQLELEANVLAKKALNGEKHDGSVTSTASSSGRMDDVLSPEASEQLSKERGNGEPLPQDLKQNLETQMGFSLNQVSIHRGQVSADLNTHLGSNAFAIGNDIFFSPSAYQPNSRAGISLIAHELVHTQQQKGGVPVLQTSMKFELQTTNKMYAMSTKPGATKKWKLGRKFGSTNTTFAAQGDKLNKPGNEAGVNRPSYVATGEHGGAAQEAQERFVNVREGKQMVVDQGTTPGLLPQYVHTYLVKGTYVIGAAPTPENDLRLIGEVNNAIANPKVNHNSVLYKYVDENNVELPIHLDQNGKFQSGIGKMMKVGKKKEWKEDVAGVEETYNMTWPAEFVKQYKFKKPTKASELVGTAVDPTAYVEIPQVSNVDADIKASGKYNKNTYDIQYLSSDGTILAVHVGKRNTYKDGREPLMRLESIEAKEQSAMELQAESGSFIEFETPKWFRDQDELVLRMQDAVDMTEAIADPANEITDTDFLDRFKIEGGKLYKWPFDVSDFPTLAPETNMLLYAHVTDPNWFAKIQTSDSIMMQEYESVFRERYTDTYLNLQFRFNYEKFRDDAANASRPNLHADALTYANAQLNIIKTSTNSDMVKFREQMKTDIDTEVNRISDPANKIFKDAFEKSTAINKPAHADQLELYKSKFSNLIGFIQLVLHYIYQAQTHEYSTARGEKVEVEGKEDKYKDHIDEAGYSKGGFSMMSRSSFNTIFHHQLNDEEKILFKEIVAQSPTPLFTEIQSAIDETKKPLYRERRTARAVTGHMIGDNLSSKMRKYQKQVNDLTVTDQASFDSSGKLSEEIVKQFNAEQASAKRKVTKFKAELKTQQEALQLKKDEEKKNAGNQAALTLIQEDIAVIEEQIAETEVNIKLQEARNNVPYPVNIMLLTINVKRYKITDMSADDQAKLQKQLDQMKADMAKNKVIMDRDWWKRDKFKPVPLTNNTSMFLGRTGSSGIRGPKIKKWLDEMVSEKIISNTYPGDEEKVKEKGQDMMNKYATPGLSASQGARRVQTDITHKDYKKAQFEYRGGPSLPASQWVEYVKKVYMSSRHRGGDTVDDRSTDANEASPKTHLNK